MRFIKNMIKAVIVIVACAATLIAMLFGATIKAIGFVAGVLSHLFHDPSPKATGTKEA